jgi:hypothetical protein
MREGGTADNRVISRVEKHTLLFFVHDYRSSLIDLFVLSFSVLFEDAREKRNK